MILQDPMRSQNKVTFFNFLSVILLRGIAIFTAPIFSRLLGSGGYGIVSLYNTWVSVASVAFSLQAQATLPAARVEFGEEEQDAYQSAATGLAITGFLVISALILLFLQPVSQALGLSSFLICMILLQAFFDACLLILNQKFVFNYRSDLNCLTSVLVAVLNLVLSLLMIWLLPKEQNYYGRVLGMVFTYVLMGSAAIFYIFFQGRTFYSRRYWKFCLPIAIPFIFYNLSDLMLGLGDQVMLQHMVSDSAVGMYSLAMSFGTIMLTIYGALNASWMPFFFDDMKCGRRDSVKKQAANYTEIFTVLSAGFLLLHREVYHIFAGRDFWEGTACIPAFVAGAYVNFLCTFPINLENYHKKTRAVAVVTLVSVLLNVVLNGLMIPAYGMLGAAIATAIAHLSQFIMHYIYAKWFLAPGDYPFPAKQWILGSTCFLAALLVTGVFSQQWLLRWGLGACLGLWELWRLKKRKTIF